MAFIASGESARTSAAKCPRRYRRADLHRYAKRAFRGHGRTGPKQRRTLDRIIRCQRRAVSRPILRRHRARYRAGLRKRREAHQIAQMGNRGLGLLMLRERGQAGEWPCLDDLWQHESGWNHLAENPSSGAYGIPQALPGWKMASHGADWRTNPRTQIAWGLDYLDGRYGGPCGGLAHFRSYNWY